MIAADPEDSNRVWVESDEPLVAASGGEVDIVFKRSGVSDALAVASVGAGVMRFDVAVPESFDSALEVDDIVSIVAGEVRDLAGNPNQSIRSVVSRDVTAPRVTRVTATEPTPAAQAWATLDGADAQGDSADAVRIEAKAGALADGAVGNEWSIDLAVRGVRPSDWSSDQLTSVQVSAATRRILVVALAIDDEPSNTADIDDVVNALNAHQPFSSLFAASVVAGAGARTPVDTGGRLRFTGGASTVDFRLEWSEAVDTGNEATHCTQSLGDPVRVRLIEIDADGDRHTDFDLEGFRFGDSDVILVDGEADDSIRPRMANCDYTTPGALPGTLVARIWSGSLDNLPGTQSTVLIRSGAVTDFAGNASGRHSAVRVERPDEGG